MSALPSSVAVLACGRPGGRHELRNALRSGPGAGLRVPTGLLVDLGGDDARRDDLADGSGADHIGLVFRGNALDRGFAGVGSEERAHGGQKHAEHREHGRDDGQDGKADGGGSRYGSGYDRAREVRGGAGGTHGGLSGGFHAAYRLDGRAATPPDEFGRRVDAPHACACRFEGQVARGASQLGREVVVGSGEPRAGLVHPAHAGGSHPFDAPACFSKTCAYAFADPPARLAFRGEFADLLTGLRLGQHLGFTDRLAHPIARPQGAFAAVHDAARPAGRPAHAVHGGGHAVHACASRHLGGGVAHGIGDVGPVRTELRGAGHHASGRASDAGARASGVVGLGSAHAFTFLPGRSWNTAGRGRRPMGFARRTARKRCRSS